MGKDLTITLVPPHSLVLEVENLTVSRGGNVVVEDANIQVKHGEFVGIVGPNGSGKTSLLMAILGILKSNKGSVKIYGIRNNQNTFKSKIT